MEKQEQSGSTDLCQGPTPPFCFVSVVIKKFIGSTIIFNRPFPVPLSTFLKNSIKIRPQLFDLFCKQTNGQLHIASLAEVKNIIWLNYSSAENIINQKGLSKRSGLKNESGYKEKSIQCISMLRKYA